MKAIKFLKDIFAPEDFQGLDIEELARALADGEVRTRWLETILQNLRDLNLQIDRVLLEGPDFKVADLCAKRRAYQEVLEAVLSARRAKPKDLRHNPRPVEVSLDRVTA